MMTKEIEMVVTVKAYPSISRKHSETVCVAGVRTDLASPQWVRLYPVKYRDMHFADRFKKYQGSTLQVSKASDPRPESYKPVLDTITLGNCITTSEKWRDRRALIDPLVLDSMCQLHDLQHTNGVSVHRRGVRSTSWSPLLKKR